jgi:hypothetical protein
MEPVDDYEWQIEIRWRQTGPEEWEARLIDLRTGEQLEARSEPELLAALKQLQEGGAPRRAGRKRPAA